MKSNKYIKILYIIVISIIIVCNITTCCKAEVIVDTNYTITETNPDARITTAAGTVLGAIRLIGTILSVLIVAVIGIEYIVASPEGKADYKKNMYPYLIGVALLFAGSSIPQFIYNVIRK